MNISFVANFDKTVVFEAIADNLIASGIGVFWFVTKGSQAAHLSDKYGSNHILLLDTQMIAADNDPVADFKVNELVFGDRVWRLDKESGIRYLTNIQRPVYDFIMGNAISYVFGEATWGHELLINRMCNRLPELRCHYYSHGRTRIPNGRLLFFSDEKQTRIVEKPSGGHMQITGDLVLERPSYLLLYNKKVAENMSWKGYLRRIKRLLTGENIEKTDPNTNKGFDRIAIPVREVWHQLTYPYLRRSSMKAVEGSKYIFFGFHKQPEASIDVCGRYFENQMENVVNLWRQLPPGWKLVVKEHTNAIGDRGVAFFRKLSSYPGIVLMHEKADSHSLIRNAQLVATNTGTMALEAAIMGVPAITLSEVFFNRLNYCCHRTWTDLEKYDSIEQLIAEIRSSPNNVREYTEYIMSNSFEGEFIDALARPSVLESESIARLTNAILAVIG